MKEAVIMVTFGLERFFDPAQLFLVNALFGTGALSPKSFERYALS